MTLRPLRTFELTISSKLEELESVQKLISEAAAAFGLSEDMAYWMELTVSESVINAIRHGNHFDPAKKARLAISFDGENVEVIVEDQGEGFNLDELGDPYSMVLVDREGRAGLDLGITGAPETFAVDAMGQVVAKASAPLVNQDEIDRLVAALEAPPRPLPTATKR